MLEAQEENADFQIGAQSAEEPIKD